MIRLPPLDMHAHVTPNIVASELRNLKTLVLSRPDLSTKQNRFSVAVMSVPSGEQVATPASLAHNADSILRTSLIYCSEWSSRARLYSTERPKRR